MLEIQDLTILQGLKSNTTYSHHSLLLPSRHGPDTAGYYPLSPAAPTNNQLILYTRRTACSGSCLLHNVATQNAS